MTGETIRCRDDAAVGGRQPEAPAERQLPADDDEDAGGRHDNRHDPGSAAATDAGLTGTG